MTDTTDIAAQEKWLRAACEAAADCGYVHNISVDGRTIEWLLDQLGAERQRADKAELELIKPLPIGELIQRLEGQTYEKWFSQSDLKGDQVPVGEIVAWNHSNEERKVDFRFLRFDVQPGTKLYAVEPAPAAKSDLLTRAQALAVETRALSSRIQAGE